MQHHLTKKTSNKKVGSNVAASTTSSDSCPPACPMATVCYGKKGPASWHWRKLDKKERGTNYTQFLKDVEGLANGSLFRINVTGDLPSFGGIIDSFKLSQLDKICKSKNLIAWTYTHHHVTQDKRLVNLQIIKEASRSGFCINLSTEDIDEALDLYNQGHSVSIANTELFNYLTINKGVVKQYGDKLKRFVPCPEQRTDLPEGVKVTCSNCRLCTNHNPNKRDIVVFKVH